MSDRIILNAEIREGTSSNKARVDGMISEGKKTLALVKLIGKNKGSFLGLEPIEKSIIIHIMSLFSIESGFITEIQEIRNELDVMKQLGHIY